MATRRQGLKRIKKRPLSERSEFRTLPVSVPGGACSPCEARTAIVGAAFFAPLFWRSKKAGRPPGRTPGCSPRQWALQRFTRPAPAATAPCVVQPLQRQRQQSLRERQGQRPATDTVTLRYTCCASTQGERRIRT